MIQEIFSHNTLIFGCGNMLLGDDGFGPEVIAELERRGCLPEDVYPFDVGTSIRDVLFDMILYPTRPEWVFIVDAVTQPGREPGEVFEIDLDALPEHKVNDFSLHQFPSVNLLRELRDSAGVNVRVVVVQTASVPDSIQPGLSPEVRAAVERACEWLLNEVER